MNISLIVAVSDNNVIGVKNNLPWQISKDLKYFKEKTLGKTIIMGRKTIESIGRTLPKRRNIVLTRDKNFKFENAEVVHSLEDVFKILNTANVDKSEEVFICGGSEIYNLFLPYCSKLYITRVHLQIENGDSFFPSIPTEYKLISEINDSENGIKFTYQIFTK